MPGDRRDSAPVPPGEPAPIRSAQNRLVKLARRLRTARGREKERRYLIEGRRAVREALRAGAPIEAVLHGEPSDAPSLFRELDRARIPRHPVSPAVFERLATTVTSQGVLAIARAADVTVDALVRLADAAPGPAGRRAIALLGGLQDPGNVGTVLRTALGFGFGGAVLARGTADLYNPKVVRATAAALAALPVARAGPLEEFARARKACGYAVAMAVAAGAGATPLHAWRPPPRVALAVGNEGRGIEPEALALADEVVSIPLDRRLESLNAGVAFAVIAYRLTLP